MIEPEFNKKFRVLQIPEFNTLSYAIENIGIGSPNAYLAIDSNGRITLQNIVSGIQDKEFRVSSINKKMQTKKWEYLE